jgi:predicted dithiol-disulfide oxidoreductase (DUF899 family)
MGWTLSLGVVAGGDFNFDFNVSVTEEQQRDGSAEYNYRAAATRSTAPSGAGAGRPVRGQLRHRRRAYPRDRPGMSAFVRRGRRRLPHLFDLRARPRRPVGHVSVARPRPLGRNEHGLWWKRHDEYQG